MDVTCERCGTEYDFDDALVSERGTTVKCTNCGAQFRVFRPVPAAGPERWVVRTVDGRELVFSALRELQAAISTGVVGRDDVLSRGGGRPRRLGSIAELEPFFKQAIVIAATSTSPGLGLPTARVPQRHDGSAPFQLPRNPEEGTPKRSGTLPPPPPILNMPPAADRSEVRARGAGDPAHTSLTGSVGPSAVAAPRQAAMLQNLVAADLSEPITVPRSGAHQASLGQGELRSARERTVAVPIGPLPPANAPPPVMVVGPGGVRRPMEEATIQDNAVGVADTIAAISETMTQVDGSAMREMFPRQEPQPPEEEAPAAQRRSRDSGVVERRAGPMRTPVPEPVQRGRAPLDSRLRANMPQMTPSPAEARISYIPDGEPSVSPRFSMPAMSKRGSSVRWIVGVVLVGATALLAATVGRKYFTAPAPTQTAAPAADNRVAKLLEDGEKSLREGDLESAKEQFDKSSALAENDPQVAAHLAHLAVVRADLRWLKVRILPAQSPEATLAQAELSDALEKMKKAVERAATLMPGDAGVRRYRVDALRIAGDRAGARKLVGEMPAGGKTPEDDLTLAALDLAEEKPAWPTVIERLRSAAAVDGNLGRARAMLVYALASSGDYGGAKAEHDRLAALSRPHPLTAMLLAFMARIETERPAASAPPVVAGGGAKSTGAAPASTPPQTAGTGAGAGTGTKPPGGRIADDYVAPNAGSVDVSDMNNHPPHQPAPTATEAPAPAPTPTPTQAPAPAPTTPPAVDTSDLPGFGK